MSVCDLIDLTCIESLEHSATFLWSLIFHSYCSDFWHIRKEIDSPASVMAPIRHRMMYHELLVHAAAFIGAPIFFTFIHREGDFADVHI